MFNSCQTFPVYGRSILCVASNYKSDPASNRNGWVDVPGHRIITRPLKILREMSRSEVRHNELGRPEIFGRKQAT